MGVAPGTPKPKPPLSKIVISVIESLMVLAGCVLVVSAVWQVDHRLGMGLAGFLLALPAALPRLRKGPSG